jgi:hypothetical protein
MAISVYGAGTLGARVIARSTGPIHAVTRTTDRHDALRALGADPTTTWPRATDRVVLCLPGSAAQLEAITRLRRDRPTRAVLVSTTGYHTPYAGHVGPDSPMGTGDRARAAAATEDAFRDWMGDHGVIVRLGGLYTATRGAAAAFARTGRARMAPGNAPLPSIHYDDAAALVVAALDEAPPVILGVTEAPTRRTFYTVVAGHLGVALPAFAPDGPEATFDTSCGGLLAEPPRSFRTALPAAPR